MDADNTVEQSVDPLAIIDRLSRRERQGFPVDAVEDARRHREEVIPALVECLDSEIALAADGLCDNDSPTLISLCLLIEFNASEAWPVIQKLVLLPDDQPFEVLGDGIHEILPTTVALWGTGDLEQIAQWCLDTDVNTYCRSSLARGVCDAYGRGLLSRQAVLDFNKRMLEEAVADDLDFRAFLICNLLDLHGDELTEVILDLFRRDMVETAIVDRDSIESEFSRDREGGLQRFRDSMVPIEKFTDQLKSWAGYKPEPKYDPPERVYRQDAPPLPVAPTVPETVAASPRIRRNAPCPCGSGKKFKKCCKNA